MQQGFVHSKVLDKVLRRQHLLAKQLERTTAVLAKISCSQASLVEVTTKKPRMAVQMVFDDMPVEKVLWDAELQPEFDSQGDIDTHEGLLEQLALGIDDELIHSMDTTDGLLQQLAHGDEYLDSDGSVFDERPPVDVQWDEQRQSDKGIHDGLLQLLADGEHPGEECPAEVVNEVHSLDANGEFLLIEDSTAVCVDMTQLSSELDLNTMERPLNTPSPSECIQGGHLLLQGCAISSALHVIAEMPYQGSTHQLLESTRPCFPAKQSGPAKVMKEVLTDYEGLTSALAMANDLNSQGLLQNLAFGRETEVASESLTVGLPTHAMYNVFNGMPNRVVVWVEMPAVFVLHGGLLQLASGMECTFDKMENQDDRLDTCKPSTKSASKGDSNISLLPMCKWSDSFGVSETRELHMTHEFGTKGYQLSGYIFSDLLVLDMGQEAGNDCNILKEMQSEILGNFSLWHQINNTAFKFEIYDNAYLMNLKHEKSMSSRQWDPGIIELIMQGTDCKCKFCTRSNLWTRCYDVVGKEFLNVTTAWGQAVFRGDGNVMTQMWPKRSPRWSSPLAESQLKTSQSQRYIKELCTSREGREEFQKQRPKRKTGRASSSSGYRDPVLRFPYNCSRSRFDLAGVATGVTAFCTRRKL